MIDDGNSSYSLLLFASPSSGLSLVKLLANELDKTKHHHE